jgi:hypothetical protein
LGLEGRWQRWDLVDIDIRRTHLLETVARLAVVLVTRDGLADLNLLYLEFEKVVHELLLLTG